jgi:hypothetical protein
MLETPARRMQVPALQTIQQLDLLTAAKLVTNTMKGGLREDFLAQYARFVDGNINAGQLYRQTRNLLEDSIRRAARAGRIAAGGGELPTVEELSAIDRTIKAQSDFLKGFVRDMAGGYGRVDWRLSLYLQRVDGAMYEAFARNSPAMAVLHWSLDPLAQHCADCLATAKGSSRGMAPGHYLAGDLPHIPRDGTCDCKMGCKCSLHAVV